MIHYTTLTALTLTATFSVVQVTGEILYAETATISFAAWAADLDPGHTLRQTNIEGRACYCKGSATNLSFGGESSAAKQPSGSYFEMLSIHPPTLDYEGTKESSFEYIMLQASHIQHRRKKP